MTTTMKQSPMKLFDTILYQSRSDRGSLSVEDAETINIHRLLDIELVQEGDFAMTYDCGCGDAETTFVEWSENPRDGTLRPFIKCRYCGVTRLEIDELRTWSIQNHPCVSANDWQITGICRTIYRDDSQYRLATGAEKLP